MADYFNPVVDGNNKLKLGLFCTNTVTVPLMVPERYNGDWETALAVAQQADRIGLEAIIPIARWRGYIEGDFDHYTNQVLDAFTYAAGVSQATRYSTIFATAHAMLFHPVIVAKQSSTIDHISRGRFALNIVGGWNRPEFDMFGVDLPAHEDRYRYLKDWLLVVRKLWTATEEFNVKSEFFDLKNLLSLPQPLRPGGIPIMNAGASETGNRFAAANADMAFIVLNGTQPDEWAVQAAKFRKLMKQAGREIQLWTNAVVTIRDTDQEAEEYVNNLLVESLDTKLVDNFIATMSGGVPMEPGSERYNVMRRIIALGNGLPITGSPKTAAHMLQQVSEAGFDGVVLTAIDFSDGVERLGRQVLPLLEAAGLRKVFTSP